MNLDWQYGSSLLSEYDADGFLGIQIDAYGEQASGMPTFEAIHPQGFAGRPRDPSEAGAGTNLYFFQGDQAFVLSTQDPRSITGGYVPGLTKGSSIQYGDRGVDDDGNAKGPSFYLIDGDDGTHTAYFEYEDGSTAHLFTFGVDGNGDPIITIAHGDGQALEFFKGKSILKNKSGSVFLQLDDDGMVLNGNIKGTGALEVNGARIDPTGDFITKTGVSLTFHVHPTAMGPSGTPVPTSTPAP